MKAMKAILKKQDIAGTIYDYNGSVCLSTGKSPGTTLPTCMKDALWL